MHVKNHIQDKLHSIYEVHLCDMYNTINANKIIKITIN